MEHIDRKKAAKNMQTEVDASFLYREVSRMEKDKDVSTFYSEMSAIENNHAAKVAERARKQGIDLSITGPSWRARFIALLGRKFGKNIILGALMETEKSISSVVISRKKDSGQELEGNEDRHVEILKSIEQMSGEKLAQVEGRHRSVGGNALRAAVLGANDGLVSNMSLVMGVAGATAGGKEVLIAGVAGLLAGAISMALGEWISVRSSRELYEHQMDIEMDEIENNPEEEKQELILLYRAKGLPEEEASSMAEGVFRDREKAHGVMVQEELGIQKQDLKGSAWEAAISSFMLFVTGAIIPLFPFFFLEGKAGIITSLCSSTIGLFAIGAAITLITGKNFFRSGGRQVLFGLAAAMVTFGIGKLIGISISG